MSELQVGDKVRVLHVSTVGASAGTIGKDGTVVRIRESGNYDVRFAGETFNWIYSDDELELIEAEPTVTVDDVDPELAAIRDILAVVNVLADDNTEAARRVVNYVCDRFVKERF